MRFTREQGYAALASLEPASIFLDSYRLRRLPEDLDLYFRPPEELFLAPETQELYTHGRLVPVLDNGNFDLVTFLEPDTSELVQINVESPSERRETFQHWPQYLADLMIRVGESLDDDERIRRIAELVGFTHADELFDYFRCVRQLAADDESRARREFVFKFS